MPGATASGRSDPSLSGPVTEQLPASVSPAPVTHSRNELIDVVRLIAAAGIIFIHAARSDFFAGNADGSRDLRNIFRFAVPFYLFASFYYQSSSFRRNPHRSLGQFLLGRFNRLYVPFLAWSVIYLLARDLKRVFLDHAGLVPLTPGLLWKGVEYHLWFLPFLFAFSVVLALIRALILRHDPRLRFPLIALAIAAGIVFAQLPMPAHWDEVFDNPTYAYVQFWRSLPAAFWAMAFAWFMTMGPVVYVVPPILSVAGVGLALFASLWQVVSGLDLVMRGLSGLGCMLAALGPWRGPILARLAAYGRNAYGIYLCHVLIGEIVRAVADKAHMETSPMLDLLIFAASFAGSLALVQLLARSRWTAWLNG
jgi:surface polysaccharide O-acyltransferase-like enzyme